MRHDATPTAFAALDDRGGPAQPLLRVGGLKKRFAVRGGGVLAAKQWLRAVDDVAFEIAKGETLGMVGESGCGKSTTARLIARLIEPDAGELVFDGDAVGRFGGMALKTFRRRLQMVFQDSFASLNPRLSLLDAVAYGPRVHGVTAVRRASGPARCSIASASRPRSSDAAIRTSSPAASASASTSRARSPSSRAS